MKSKKMFFITAAMILLCLLGISSAHFSLWACEQEAVVSVLLAGHAFAPPRVNPHKTEVAGKEYDYSDTKTIVNNTLRCRPKLREILEKRRDEMTEFELAQEDSYFVFSFSHGKVIFPFIVAIDVEVGVKPTDGTRVYYLVFFGHVNKIMHKATYRI